VHFKSYPLLFEISSFVSSVVWKDYKELFPIWVSFPRELSWIIFGHYFKFRRIYSKLRVHDPFPVAQQLVVLVDSPVFFDFTFKVEDGTCSAHKGLLMARCSNYRWTGNNVVVKTRKSIMLKFLHYVYTDEVTITANEAKELIFLAKQFSAYRLHSICQARLSNSLSEINCCEYYALAAEATAFELESLAKGFMQSKASKSGLFKKRTPQQKELKKKLESVLGVTVKEEVEIVYSG